MTDKRVRPRHIVRFLDYARNDRALPFDHPYSRKTVAFARKRSGNGAKFQDALCAACLKRSLPRRGRAAEANGEFVRTPSVQRALINNLTCARRIHSAVKRDTICRASELTSVNCRDYLTVGLNKVAARAAEPLKLTAYWCISSYAPIRVKDFTPTQSCRRAWV